MDSLVGWLDGGSPSLLELTLLLAFAVIVVDLALAAVANAAVEEAHPSGRDAEAP
ncbi:MAG: hypothetical protein WB493_16490 [Anaeromyxobacteraceae bacterium]